MAAKARRTDLVVEARRQDRVAVLTLHGEVRAELVGRLHEAAAGVRREGAVDLLVDLSRVTFIDSASVGEMVRLHEDAAAIGGRTVWFGLPRIVARVLDVTGLTGRLETAPDEPAARARLG